MKANLATSLIAYARGGVRKQLLVLCLLTLCAGNMWADEITVYVTGEIFIGTGEDAWDNATSTIKVDVRKGHPECFDCDGFNGLYNQDMTNTGYTYNGYPIYSYTFTPTYGGGQFRFKHYKNEEWKENYTSDWHSTTEQIYRGYYNKGHQWMVYGRDVTFYATPEKMDGSKWEEGTHSLFANFKYGDGESEWKRQQMTKTAYTYNGDAIYTCTMLLPYNVIKNVQFLYNDGSDHDLYVYTPSPQLTANDVDGKILLGWNGSHNWVSYGRDVTIYTIPDYLFKDIETPYDESIHYPAVCIQMGTGSTWNTVNMTKTSYTYATYPIYKATILIDQNKFWEYQIKYFKTSDNTQVDLYKFNQDEPKTEYAPSYIDDKLYHGWNGESHDFFPYTYDVKLDQQGGSGGTESIKATDGANLPDATMPGRDGYIFGGYYTEVGGNGDMYYDTNGNSSTQWNSRTITTLYAKWTARNYIVNLEDPPTTTPVTVTFDATLSSITPPTKMYYTFDGYWTDNDDTGATLDKQLIDKDGNWKKSISPYTGTSGDSATWIYPNGKSLFAKWDEDLHDVKIAVSPADAGVVQVSGETISSVSNVGYATHSPVLTAVPSNAAWVFKEWRVDEKLHLVLQPYSQFGEKMKIFATGADQRLTAVFEKRYNLVGSKYEIDKDKAAMATGGMPGWTFGSGADFTINSYTANGDDAIVDLSYTCTLEAGTYIFEIHDRKKGESLGRKDGTSIYVLKDGDNVELRGGEGQDQSIFFYPEHEGQYTFRITNMRKEGEYYYPTVTVERPHAVYFGTGYAGIDDLSSVTSGTAGGTLEVTTSSGALANEDYVTYGTNVTYTPSPETGYTFEGFYTSNEFTYRFTQNNPWIHYNLTGDDHVYAKFVEKATAVTLSNDRHGHVEIDGMTVSSTTVGVTTTRELTAVPNEGYKFSHWTLPDNADFEMIEGDVKNSTITLRGKGAGDAGEIIANFTAREYTVTLEGMDADSDAPILVNVTYDAVLPKLETKHTKAHYDLLGYWAANDDHGMDTTVQLIGANGNWIPDVTGYTGNDGAGQPTWVHDFNISLFAQWTEHPYTVDLKVSPEGAGTIDKGTTIEAYYVKPTDLITATPANPAWKFKGWQYSENVRLVDDTGKDNTVQIRAEQDGTLTAVFEPRFCLVGSIWDDSDNGGMPGWHDYDHTADFNINSYTDLSTMNLTCVRSLDPNTTYKFEVHDKVNGKNLGYATPSTYIGDQSLLFNTQNNDVFLRVNGYGECTFTISALSSGDLYPTVSVAIPSSHQLNLEWADVDIDNNWNKTSRGTGGSVSAQTTESGRHFDIHNGEYVAHGGDITYTATPATGYTFEGWYNNDYNTRFSTTNPYTSSNIQTTENVEAKFVEKATAVTLSNDRHGHVEIDGMTVSSTTVGVTTTRELTAVPNEGYKFSHWTLPDNADFEMIEGDVKNSTITLRGKGAGDAGEIVATFTECWVLSAQSEGRGSAEFTIANITVEDGKAIGYADIALPANTNLQFKVVDKSTSSEYKNGVDQVYYMTYGNSKNWLFATDKTYNCGITTAGKGSYRFNWNFTDKTMTVVYPVSYQVNYGAAVGGSVTSVLDDDGKEIPNGGYVREGGSVTYEATANNGYTFTGWCPDDSYGDIFTDINPWKNSNVTAPSNAYAKFHSTNFVIYRTGDKSSDPRAVWDDVESYEGGTISETIEFRMKVNKLDYWYTLCLPFEVNAVQVWDEVDGAYYDIVPYWRTEGKYYTGHYILRKPVTTTNFAIEGFEGKDRWIDPESSDVLPSKNIPYIIQWHDEYFQGKYISFFGTAGQIISTAMDKGSYASSDEKVNIYANNSMTTGMVRDAYLLDPSYGTDGAWMREELGTDRSVLPFECFILANEKTTAKYRVLRRDMADDTPTGLDTLFKKEDTVSKVLINNRIYIIRGGKMYTIQGTFVKEVE